MVQNGQISDFHGLLTSTLTLDPGMIIIFFHLSSSTTCIPNFIEIEGTFCGRTDGRTEICHPQYQVDFQSLEVDIINQFTDRSCYHYLVNGLSNLDETYTKYSSAPNYDRIRFWRSRSKVKVTACRGVGEGIHVDAGESKSIFQLCQQSTAAAAIYRPTFVSFLLRK